MAYKKQPASLLVIALTLFCVATLLPVAMVLFKFSTSIFQQPDYLQSIFIDARQWILLGRSLVVSLGVALMACLLGLPVAFALNKLPQGYRNGFEVLLLIPLFIPPYVMAGAWIHLFNPDGWLNTFMANAFGFQISLHSIFGCMWTLGVSFFSLVALLVSQGLRQLDWQQVDLARLSAGKRKVFLVAIWPQLKPYILAASGLVVLFSLAQYSVPSLLGVNTYPVEIFTQFSAFYDETAAIGKSFPLLMLVLFLIGVQYKLMSKCTLGGSASKSFSTSNRNKAQFTFSISFLVLILSIVIVMPLVSVCMHVNSLSVLQSTFDMAKMDLITTLKWGVLASLIAIVVAYPIGYFLARGQGRLRNMVDVLGWLGIAIPGTIFGLGVIEWMNLSSGFRQSSYYQLLLPFAYVGLFAPFAIRVFEVMFHRSDLAIDEAAAVHGCHWWQKLFLIDLPRYYRFCFVAGVLVFLLVLSELNVSVLLVPPGLSTLSIRIDNLLHYGANHVASALCLIIALLVISLIGVASLILKISLRVLK